MRWLGVKVTYLPVCYVERPGNDCIAGYVGPRAGLDGCRISRPRRHLIPRPHSSKHIAVQSALSLYQNCVLTLTSCERHLPFSLIHGSQYSASDILIRKLLTHQVKNYLYSVLCNICIVQYMYSTCIVQNMYSIIYIYNRAYVQYMCNMCSIVYVQYMYGIEYVQCSRYIYIMEYMYSVVYVQNMYNIRVIYVQYIYMAQNMCSIVQCIYIIEYMYSMVYVQNIYSV